MVAGQVGSGQAGYETFSMKVVMLLIFMDNEMFVLNTRYAPMMTAWSETHSKFIDTMFNSIE